MEGDNRLRGEPPARSERSERRKVGGRLFGEEKGQSPSVPHQTSNGAPAARLSRRDRPVRKGSLRECAETRQGFRGAGMPAE